MNTIETEIKETIQSKELNKAVFNCGSIAELSRRIKTHRQFIQLLLKRAETISEKKDLCKVDLAIEMEIKANVSWRKICPKTAKAYLRLMG